MTHQNWQIHSGTGRTELEKNEYARLTLSTLYTVFIRYPLNQKKRSLQVWRARLPLPSNGKDARQKMPSGGRSPMIKLPHLSHHSYSRATTWGATILDRPKGSLAHYLGPIQSKAQTPRLATLLATYPFFARGVHEANKTGSNEPPTSLCTFCTFPQ
jgi:hypothetical protein